MAMALELMRFNQQGQQSSDNMADYDIWECKNEGDDRTCSFKVSGLMEYAQVCLFISRSRNNSFRV